MGISRSSFPLLCAVAVWSSAPFLCGAPAHAGPDPQDVILSLSDVNGLSPNAAGIVAIKSDPVSTDDLRLMVSGLMPNTTHTVYLAASRDTGALPVQFVGEFTTNASGQGFFSAVTEVIEAYAPANPGATLADGTAPRLAGALARGGFNVALDFVRVYQGIAAPNGPQTVFTRDGVSPGGAHVLSTNGPIPQELPSAQFLYQIVAMHSQKCIGVESDRISNGLRITQQTCAGPGQRAQLFRFLPTGKGTFELHPQNSLRCVEIMDASTDDVAPAIQVRCRGIQASQQQFSVVPTGPPGFFNLMPDHSGKCLDIERVSMDDGARVIQFQCLGGSKPNQLFRITRADAT